MEPMCLAPWLDRLRYPWQCYHSTCSFICIIWRLTQLQTLEAMGINCLWLVNISKCRALLLWWLQLFMNMQYSVIHSIFYCGSLCIWKKFNSFLLHRKQDWSQSFLSEETDDIRLHWEAGPFKMLIPCSQYIIVICRHSHKILSFEPNKFTVVHKCMLCCECGFTSCSLQLCDGVQLLSYFLVT